MGKCEQCNIKQFNALKSLNKEELVRISDCKTTRVVKKGEIIFEEGEVLNVCIALRMVSVSFQN